MHVLLTETSSAVARATAQRLEAAGHVVHTCHREPDPSFPCVALRNGRCPLEDEPVDVTVAVRAEAWPRPTPAEGAATCALRHKVPLVVAGAVEGNPYARWAAAVEPGTRVVEVVETIARSPLPEHSAAATDALRVALTTAGAAATTAFAVVHRRAGGLAAALSVEPRPGPAVAATAAVRVHATLRALDRWARTIDVTGP